MGDGAEWIWNLVEQLFPGAAQIVDFSHARQHLWELARRPHPSDEVSQKAWIKIQQRRLDKGKIEKLVIALRSIDSFRQSRGGRGRILRKQRGAHALPRVSSPASLCRLECDRGWMQNGDRFPAQAVRHILGGKRRQRHHRPAMLPAQQPLRRLLGGAPPGGLISTSTSHTLARSPATALSLRARHGSEFDSGKNRRVLCHFTSSLYPFPSVHRTSSNRPSACK